MKKVTSAIANKMLRSLEEDKNYLLSLEEESRTYIRAEGEEKEAPEYHYEDIRRGVNEIDSKVSAIKHAVNVFNTTTVLDGLGITIDQALVRMAQLNGEKHRLDTMRKMLPATRVGQTYMRGRQAVEYMYANYDIEEAKRDYQAISDQINQIQIALDLANQTRTFEIED